MEKRGERGRSAFGQRMFDARKKAGRTLGEVARALNLSQSTISQHEYTGQGTSMVFQFADLYGVSARWLATGEGSMESREPSRSDVIELAQGLARLPDAVRRRLVAKWLTEIDFAIEVRTGALDEAEEVPPQPTRQHVRGT